MATVYVQMAGAALVSAGAAFMAAYNPTLSRGLYTTDGLTVAGWIVTLAPLAFAIVLASNVTRLSAEAARLIFLVYATLVGLSLGGVFRAYSGAVIGFAFIATAVAFTALSLLIMVARRDFGPAGTFLTLSLFGLIAVMLISLFMRSPTLDLVLAGTGVALFAALTAFDVEQLRKVHEERPKAAVIGALTLYLDFINLFLSSLRLSGRRR